MGHAVIYLDSNVIIRLFEGSGAVVESLRKVIDQHDLFSTSALALIECRCKPMRESNVRLLELYGAFFTDARLHVVPVDRDVIEAATRLRAEFNLKTPDAIHAASAIGAGASLFVSADSVFSRVPGLNHVLV